MYEGHGFCNAFGGVYEMQLLVPTLSMVNEVAGLIGT